MAPWYPLLAPQVRDMWHANAVILNVHRTQDRVTSMVLVEPHDGSDAMNKPPCGIATSIADAMGLSRIYQLHLNQGDAGNCATFTLAILHNMLHNNMEYLSRDCEMVSEPDPTIAQFDPNLRWD